MTGPQLEESAWKGTVHLEDSKFCSKILMQNALVTFSNVPNE
ncbi:hypothetical protein AVEN_240259-1, partial [Araneus ventricosus]